MSDTVVTRFAPSPTGSLHVGGVRTALFNYACARQTGGRFLLRIEDTDRARHQEQAIDTIVDDLRWLDIDWDEGVEVGGPNGPYRQSERLAIYQQYIQQLLDAGKAYYAFETPEELDRLREAAEAKKENFRYPRPATLPTAAQADQARADGKPVVVRLLSPQRDLTIHDDVFGAVTTPADQQDDFIIAKADGWPTYHLANVVDDALMGVTLIMRGQEFLGQSWRHVALRNALGLPEVQYAHLPLIMDMQGRKLSKRDGAVEIEGFRRTGYLPEALLNFLALLGWNPGDERERFSLQEFVEMFSLERLGKTNARFDRDKLLAFNTDLAALKTAEQLLEPFKDFLARSDHPHAEAMRRQENATLTGVLAACAGFRTFEDVLAKAGILFVDDTAYDFDPKAVKKTLTKNDGQGYDVLGAVRELLATAEWNEQAIEQAIHAYCQANELGMGKVAQPIRVAVTGSTISPGIGDTLMLLGRERTLGRIDRCLQQRFAGE
jgi:glutamyl-tRNA synthetase